jgi:hypothetical protein
MTWRAYMTARRLLAEELFGRYLREQVRTEDRKFSRSVERLRQER